MQVPWCVNNLAQPSSSYKHNTCTDNPQNIWGNLYECTSKVTVKNFHASRWFPYRCYGHYHAAGVRWSGHAYLRIYACYILRFIIRPPPFLHTTFRQKWGGCVCSNIQFLVVWVRVRKFDNHDDCRGFLKERQLRWTCTTGKSAALALILSQEAPKQLASSVVTGYDSA